MELIKILEPDFCFNDERGSLYQITHNPYAQTNAVFTRAGAVRGNNHYHEGTDEIFFILSGEVEVSVSLEEKEEAYIFKSGDMFLVPKMVQHSFEYIKDTYLIGFYENRVEKEDGTKDILSKK